MNKLSTAKKVAYLGIFSSLAAIFSYVECLIPISIGGIPGIKPGIANLVSLIILCIDGLPAAIIIMTVRVILVGAMFGNLYSIIFSFTGGLISILMMAFLKKTDKFSIVGISAGGGAFHNIGQYVVAVITLDEIDLFYYLPLLIVAGLFFGIIIGFLSNEIIRRIFKDSVRGCKR